MLACQVANTVTSGSGDHLQVVTLITILYLILLLRKVYTSVRSVIKGYEFAVQTVQSPRRADWAIKATSRVGRCSRW